MGRTPDCGDADCQAHRSFELLGKPHVLWILYLLVHERPGPWRFNEIKERLQVAPNILSDRLKALADVGLVERQAFDEMPPRVEYVATPDAVELDEAFAVFIRWTARRHHTRLPA